MKKIVEKRFKSPINLDDGYVNTYLGEYESIMILYSYENSSTRYVEIEWDIPCLGDTEHIGVWFNERNEVIDYDGVFEIPKETIEFLEEQGFNCEQIKIESQQNK